MRSKNFKTNTNLKNKNSNAVKVSKPLLTKPIISKLSSQENISKKDKLNPPQIISKSKSKNEQKNNSDLANTRQYDSKGKVKNRLNTKNDSYPKSPKPPIQLIEKPKNVNNPSIKATQTNQNKVINQKYPNNSKLINYSL